MPTPPDWVYVYNFMNPDSPVGIALAPGEGRTLADMMRAGVHAAAADLVQLFDSDGYVRQRQDIGRGLDSQRSELLDQLRAQALERGFMLNMTPGGITSAPVVDGKPLSDEDFGKLPQPEQDRIETAAKELEQLVGDAMLRMRALERGAQEQLEHLDEQV